MRAKEAGRIGWGSQALVLSAMMDPSFYPKRPPEVTRKETHISHLFFAGDLVYKIKKAVRFSFLDYSTLKRRRHFLHEEMRLNRRLAPSVYLGVLPICYDSSAWRLGGDGHPVEYTLVMRRLPERRMLPFLLESGQVTSEMIVALAEVLAPFHAQAEIVRDIKAVGYSQAVKTEWNENLSDLEPFVGKWIDAAMFHALKDFGVDFIDRHCDLFRRRVTEGRVRDVHGDLHCEHVCFAPDGIQIFDCIEFSAKFRCCDIASEIAFLLMDLEFRGANALADDFLKRYLDLMDDRELALLLPFYKCYRALVRGKVEILRSHGMTDKASRYLRLAARLSWEPMKPFLVMVCGLTGSGKSILAREVGERLGMPIISSDQVRKIIAGVSGSQKVGFSQGIYSSAMTERTYAEMAREAEKQLVAGRGAILDATFGERANRERILRLAKKHGTPLIVIHCRAAEEIARKRLAQRAAEGQDVSDGRWEIYVEQRAAFQPIQEVAPDDYFELDTDRPVTTLACECEKFLRSRLGQAGAKN
jgi:aminoglycoside phosphotransferase family enzyme/predicted kinase